MPTTQPTDNRVRLVTQNLMTYHTALTHDYPLPHKDVVSAWDDTFLTNVMNPILEHIEAIFEEMKEDAWGQEQRNRAISLEQDIKSLQETVRILSEWRG